VLKAGLSVQSCKASTEAPKQGQFTEVSFKRTKEKPLTRRYLKNHDSDIFKETVVVEIKER